jgi:imidazolonepropionase
MKTFDSIWINATLVTCEHGYGLLDNAAIAVKHGQIAWLGRMNELQASPEQLAEHVYDVEHRCITPGLVDCHTHLVFAGQRANEFELRLQGASYQDIAQQGGGIQSSVRATRAASFDDLLAQSLPRAKASLANGTTTMEIKSGYGLDWETEKKMLMVAKQLSEQLPISIKKTFLGAHTIPLEYKQNPEAYVDEVCQRMIPKVAAEQLADAVDVFCETIAFTPAQTEKIFQTAKQHGLHVKCHAEQLSNQGAAILAAKYQALSVDHLEYLTEEGIAALVESKTVAVLLPGAFYFLKETKKPPVNALLQAGVPIALATDCNPGTSPVLSLPLIMNMGCTLYGLTPEQALLGVTIHAAQALGLRESHGSLKVGKAADFAIWNVKQPVEIIYYMGYGSLLERTVKDGWVVG